MDDDDDDEKRTTLSKCQTPIPFQNWYGSHMLGGANVYLLTCYINTADGRQ